MKQVLSTIFVLFAAIASIVLGSSPAAVYATSNKGSYVALGDSVAAGFGLPSTSSNPIDQLCGRSTQAYPYLVASALHTTSFTQLACSSASVPAGLTGPQQVSSSITLPAQVSQAFLSGTPKLITITIGANDVSWNNFIEECYVTQCGSAQDNQAIQTLLTQLKVNLRTALSNIQQVSGNTPPQVMLTGYYFPLSETAPICSDTTGLTPAKIDWLSSKRHELDKTIKDVAEQYSFAKYVHLNFHGHELCTADPWVQGLQSAGPFHPTTGGQAAIARGVLRSIDTE
jgi:lysophospholipase L1-like esterase